MEPAPPGEGRAPEKAPLKKEITNMKKLIALLLACAMFLGLTACGGDDTPSGGGSGSGGGSSTSQPSGGDASTPSGGDPSTPSGGDISVDVTFESPALICSAGQSADFEMVKVMFDRNEIPYNANILASKDDFGDAKTLVVIIGGSSKGLGAAGIDADAELDRVNQLLDDAEAAGLRIVAAHIGGSGRRGSLGDRYIEPVVSRSEFCMVVTGGNDDGLFTNVCTENNIPMVEVPEMTECIEVFGSLFPA